MQHILRFWMSLVFSIVIMFTLYAMLLLLMMVSIITLGQYAVPVVEFVLCSTTLHVIVIPLVVATSFVFSWSLLADYGLIEKPSQPQISTPCENWKEQIIRLSETGDDSGNLTDHLAECEGCERHANKLLDAKLTVFDRLAEAIRRQSIKKN